MADMPKTLWAWIKRDSVPYASPMEPEWSGNEPTGPMVYAKDFYLRSDTCTPNEKLEKLIAEIEQVVSEAGKGEYGDGVRTMGKLAVKTLREVMDK